MVQESEVQPVQQNNNEINNNNNNNNNSTHASKRNVHLNLRFRREIVARSSWGILNWLSRSLLVTKWWVKSRKYFLFLSIFVFNKSTFWIMICKINIHVEWHMPFHIFYIFCKSSFKFNSYLIWFISCLTLLYNYDTIKRDIRSDLVSRPDDAIRWSS